MVNYDKVKKASLEELLDDERKLVMMNRLNPNILQYPDRYQRFYWKYSDAYMEYINADKKNMMRVIMLASKYEGETDEEEYNAIMKRLDEEEW